MARTQRIGIETRFLVPLREDRDLGRGRLHPMSRWLWLETLLRERFGAFSVLGTTMHGTYIDLDTNKPVDDESRQFILALERRRVPRLRRILAQEVAPIFRQKCIYLVVGTQAELVKHAYL